MVLTGSRFQSLCRESYTAISFVVVKDHHLTEVVSWQSGAVKGKNVRDKKIKQGKKKTVWLGAELPCISVRWWKGSPGCQLYRMRSERYGEGPPCHRLAQGKLRSCVSQWWCLKKIEIKQRARKSEERKEADERSSQGGGIKYYLHTNLHRYSLYTYEIAFINLVRCVLHDTYRPQPILFSSL